MNIIKGYKIRIYPTKEQEKRILLHMKACRLIWNYMLEMEIDRYHNGERYLTAYDMIRMITTLKAKEEFAWLSDVSVASLQLVCSSLHKAYMSFFDRSKGRPRFKSRNNPNQGYPVRSERVSFRNGNVHIEKVGDIKYKTDFDMQSKEIGKISNARITSKCGKYILTFGVECMHSDGKDEYMNDEDNILSMGIDLGVKETAVVSFNGNKLVYHNINKSKKMKDIQKKINALHKSISRKYKDMYAHGHPSKKSNNIIKEEEKLRRLYAKASNIRRNYIHHITTELIKMAPRRVVMEDLNIIGMVKNRNISRSVYEQNFGEFIRQMKYKCEWNGIEFVQAPMFYPSSRICSKCGFIKRNLKLSDRMYVCDKCGLSIDRDYNAAINLMRYSVDDRTGASLTGVVTPDAAECYTSESSIAKSSTLKQ